MDNKTCSVFGHSNIKVTDKLKRELYLLFENLVLKENVSIFFFGGFSDFDEICYCVISKLKLKYNHIKRVFVCDDYKYIFRPQKRPYWLDAERYEELTYFEMQYNGFYKRIYFRNCEIINNSDYVVFYVNHTNQSGAYKAMQYALKNKKKIFNICDNIKG